MKYKRAKRDALRALTSEVLPYEVPIPFDVTRLYEFLRWLKFSWTGDHTFTVLTRRLGASERDWLELIFDPVKLNPGTKLNDCTEFRLSDHRKDCDLRHPYEFRSRRNNGKPRILAVPHPHSMLRMAHFVHEHRDSILFYTNRSNFSIRHPHRVARLDKKANSVFDTVAEPGSYGAEQSDRDYSYVSSYFSYRQFNNINRFYASRDFQACERKYPHLMRADVSKCFDSIYTHTISWVTNGLAASKSQKRETSSTFGGQFDRLMQYLNYAETSGIIIGPETSRIFAEIILQEVDVRIERTLSAAGRVRGQQYEIKRYVDDYFVFLSDPSLADEFDEIIATELAAFKLHLNEQKQRHFATPLESRMSVAKVRIREELKGRTEVFVDNENPAASNLHFPARRAILDYKSLLVDTALEHGELANTYLYELGRRRDRAVNSYRTHLRALDERGNAAHIRNARARLVQYLVDVLDVALFIYSGAPSVSHSIKLVRLIAAGIRELEVSGFGGLERARLRDRIQRELAAQLNAVQDEASFGAHTLILLDCLIYVDPGVPESMLRGVLERRHRSVDTLDAFGVLTLLRRFRDPDAVSPLRRDLLSRAQHLIELGMSNREHETARTILMLALPSFPGARPKELAKALGDGFSEAKVRALAKGTRAPTMFSWNADEDYHERLMLKSAQFVY